MKKRLSQIGRVGGMVFLLVWQQHGLVQKVESLERFLGDERKNWVGQAIIFLQDPRAEEQGWYMGFCWDPEQPRKTPVKYADVVGKRALIEEVWLGGVPYSDVHGERQTESVHFWKFRLIPSGETIWYWDDGSLPILGVGFLRDYEEAKRCVGDTLWTKSVYTLYTLDGEGVIFLHNIQRVILNDVRWGAYANFPLRFILETDDGQIGYRVAKNLEEFLRGWYRVDPLERRRDWRPVYEEAIKRRQLATHMTPEMVRLAWGQPVVQDSAVTPRGNAVLIWIYRGVRGRVYGVMFKDGQLVQWKWVDKDEERVMWFNLDEEFER